MDIDGFAGRVDEHTSRWGPTALRYTAALLWLSNVGWKVPTAFGDSGTSCKGLCGYVQDGIANPVLPGSAWLFDTVVRPNLVVFGWSTLLIEVSLAAMLLSGRYLRVAAAIGIFQSLGIMASVANTPGEWYWSYLLMIALSLSVLVMAPTMGPTSTRTMAALTVAYGIIVAVAHAGAGFGGDANASWTLFGGATDLPDDFGRGVFPGSIALGAGLVAVGVIVWFLDGIEERVRRVIGWALVALAGLLLLTYRPDGLILGLGSRAATAGILAGLGLSVVPPKVGRSSSGTDHEPAVITAS